ncbi:DUF692 domain-containing protein [Coralloluteibacterium stylophorae]|uniref:UPF0276 protein KB893_00655 n=1 Tax=Coralloluteibacterium stylophorae TaxID=1776034 RepID=A0A8J7VQL2_9GAMM|nr:DUF692 domain-containing protein [Coralloluteibacterium stylophorae]MBS7456878.1 DUF692 domain-containing protein [Coralloluteibacterium stylophorae]
MTVTAPTPFHGFGLGLRPPHYAAAIEAQQPLDFVEVISENFMVDGGRPLHVLDRVRARYEVALHGVSMNLGSADEVDAGYLRRLRALADRIDPLWVSDHVSWTGVDGRTSHDLLPLPYTEEALDALARNVGIAQDVLGRALVLENPSTYVAFPGATLTEPAFLAALCERSGCQLLLDVNNIVVSAGNHGHDPGNWLDQLPLRHVRQIHLAGHSRGADILVDTHDAPVPDPVWALYARFMPRLGDVATMIERDDHIPPLRELLAELDRARAIAAAAGRRAA